MKRNYRKDSGGGAKKNSKKASSQAPNPQQHKITHFFKTQLANNNVEEGNNSQSETSPYFEPQNTQRRNSGLAGVVGDDKITEEVIVLSDSDSETENRCLNQKKGLKSYLDVSKAPVNKIKTRTPSNAELFESICSLSPTKNENDSGGVSDSLKIIKKGELTPETDSGEEFLSQIDIDEIISLSQEKQQKNKRTTETRVSRRSTNEPSTSSSNNKRTPTKSPKAKLNKFSPLAQFIKKRSRSGSQSSSSPSPNRKGSPKKNWLGQKSSPVKKLQFSSPIPYFLRNFLAVIDSVVNVEHNSYLLNDEDLKTVELFKTISSEAQCLYVRLFQRKWEWKVASTIKYPLIADNLLPFFMELHSNGFLMEITDYTPELECLLDLLSGEQITALAKQMKVDPSKKNKQLCKTALINSTRKQQTLCGSSSDILIQKVLKILGLTYQIDKDRKYLFSRLFILYSPPQYWEDEQDQTGNQLLKMLMNEKGEMDYPEYTINKTTNIYLDRDFLIRFHEAWTLHCEISAQLESKNWDDVIEIAEQSVLELKQILDDEAHQKHDSSLPTFLRVYTAGSVLTRISWLGVEGFQKKKSYVRANEVIEFLLSQDIYLTHYRGRFYERFVINMQHLKIPWMKVKCALESALSDTFVPNSSKLILSERFEKLATKSAKPLKKKKSKSSNQEDEDELVEIADDENMRDCPGFVRLIHKTPTRTIQGEKMDYGSAGGAGKSVFLGAKDSSGSSTASSVEQFAVEFYKTLGYKYGLHAEGSAVTSIYGLLFWDEIYNDQVSDAFHAPYQAFPLDIHFEDFFTRREGIIALKLESMRTTWSIEDAFRMMEDNWDKYFNKLSIVNWTCFPSIECAKTLVKAMGLWVTSAICERLALNYRHYRSGFPDLVVWNEEKFMFVEVKGPGDSLSPKQMLWIDYLLSISAQAEVCYVVAVSNKRIKV